MGDRIAVLCLAPSPSRSTMSPAPILISGSGLCGLLVARALATHQIPFIVYERDASPFKRVQGYRLRLSVEGLAAIQKILPAEAWLQFRAGVATTHGAGLQTIDALTGKPTSAKPAGEQDSDAAVKRPDSGPVVSGLGPKGEVYGVSRGYLRAELMKTIEDCIQFDKKVIAYTSSPHGVTAHFDDGTSSPQGCMLIGADGIHSRIAQQLSDGALRIFDTRARMIHGQTSTTAFKALGEGVFAIGDQSRAEGSVRMICNVRPKDMDDPQQTFGWTMVGSPGMIEAPDNRFQVVGKVAADLSRKLTAGWSETLKPIFTDQVEEEAGFWKMTTSSPDGVPEWKNDARVTVVGDAVHSMTPAGGNGANTALHTASVLGELIRKHGGWEDSITAEFEKEMRVIGTANVKSSFESARSMFDVSAEMVEDSSR